MEVCSDVNDDLTGMTSLSIQNTAIMDRTALPHLLPLLHKQNGVFPVSEYDALWRGPFIISGKSRGGRWLVANGLNGFYIRSAGEIGTRSSFQNSTTQWAVGTAEIGARLSGK